MPTLFSDELYEKVAAIDGESGDLAAYVNAIGQMFADVESLVRSSKPQRIPYPHFEDGVYEDANIGITERDGWGYWLTAALSLDDTEPYDGRPTLKVVAPVHANATGPGFYEVFSVEPGKTLNVKVTAKVPVGRSVTFLFDFYHDQAGGTWFGSGQSSFVGTGEWKTVSFPIVLPADCYAIDLGLYTNTNASPVTYHVAEISGSYADDEEFESWGRLLNPDKTAPEAALLWLAQLAGVRIPVGTNRTDMETLIAAAEARRRGTVTFMVEVAQRLLTGTKTVYVSERDTSPYHLTIVTRTAETPDSAAVLKALLAIKPAGIALTYTTASGVVWNTPTHQWNQAGLVKWDDTSTVVP